MIYSYIVDTTETQVFVGKIKRAIIQVNKALTGTIKVIDNSSGTTANIATITNPAVGDQYEYWGLQTGLRIIASGACDITVSADLSNGGV